MSTPIRIKRSAIPGKVPQISDLQLGELAINTYDGKAYLKKDVSGTESIVNVGGGYPGKTYYVSESGLDTNDGENISSAFLTIKKALSVASIGDTIEISSGTFTEIFPLTVPAGVIVRGKGLRSTIIQPTSGTERLDCFLMNGETTVEELTVTNFYYNSSTDTGYAFRFAPGMVTTTRSPYVQRVTVLTRGSVTTASDPYGFDTPDNYPTTKVAGRGAFIDGSVVSSATLEPAILFNEATFITPNQTGLKMTNGARAEWVNCFTYFSSVSIDGSSGSVGVGSTANATLKLAGLTTSISPNYVIKYYQGGPAVAIGTVTSVDGAYVTISGKGSGIFNAVGIGSTQDVRIFQSNGTTQVGTASTILWADYQKFGADLRAIGAASNFGTIGVRGDGAGVQLRLFGYNFGCVGSGKTFTQDPTLTVRSNEAIQLNGGRVFYQSVDQLGNFRVGNIFEISQETGAVSLASTSDINIAGTATIQNLNVIGVSTFSDPILHSDSNFNTDQTTYNLINSAAGAVNFAGAGTSIVIGATTGITTIRNYRVNLSGGQDSFTTTNGTLVVAGGVGISSNLNVGKDFRVTGVSTFVLPVRLDSSLRVAGVSTFVDDVEFNDHIRVAGVSTFSNPTMINSNLNVTGITTTGNFRVTGISTLTGDVQLSNNLQVTGVSTFSNPAMINSNLNVTGITTTGNFRVTGVSTLTGDTNLTNNLNVSGITTTGNLRVTGVSTLTGDTNLTNNLNVAGITTTSTFRVTGISTLTGNVELSNALRVAGVSTFSNPAMINSNLNVTGITTTSTFRVTGISTLTGDVELSNALRVAGVSTFSNPAMINSNLNVTGVTTTGNLRVTGVSTLTGDTNLTNNLNISGITTTATFRVTGISTLTGNVELSNALRVAGVSTFSNPAMINSNLNVTGITTTATFRVTGISTLTGNVEMSNALRVAGVSTFSNPAMINSNLNVTGITTTGNLRVTGISTLSGDVQFSNNIQVSGVGTIANFTISSGIITGPSAIVIDPAAVGGNTGSVRIKGDLIVDGTTATVNSTTLEIADTLIGIGTTAILIVIQKSCTVSGGSSIITGIDTSALVVGYGVSDNAGGTVFTPGASIVSIGNNNVTVDDFAAGAASVMYFINPETGDQYSDGGGIALRGTTDKTLTWSIAQNAWQPNVNFNVPANYQYKINGSRVIDENELVIPNAYITGIATIGTLINSTTFSTPEVYANTGIITDLTSTYLNVLGITTTTTLYGSYIGVTTASFGVLENLNVRASGFSTIPYFINTNSVVSGISSISTLYANSGIVTSLTVERATVTDLVSTASTITRINNTDLISVASTITRLDSDNIDVLNVDVGFATVTTLSNALLYSNIGIITTLTSTNSTLSYLTGDNLNYTGIGTIFSVYATNFVGTYSTAVNLNVTGISTFANIANVYSVGLSTISYLTGIDLNYSGIGTVNTFNSSLINVTTLNGSGISSLANLYGSDIQYIGVSTLTNLRGTNLYYSGLSTAVNFNSTDTIVSGAASISTLRVNVGYTTNFYVTNSYSAGITSIATLNVNTGVVTTLTATNSTQGYLIGTNFYYSGIGSVSNLYSNVGFVTFLSGTNLNYSGVSTVVSFRATDVNVSGTTTVTTLLVSPNNQLTHLSNGVNLAFSGIGTIDTFRSNVGFVTTLSGTNLNYSGVGTISSIQNININSSGVGTFGSLISQELYVTGISTFDSAVKFSGSNALSFNNFALNISHSGSQAQIYNGAGDLIVGADGNSSIRFERVGVATIARFTHNGSNELYHAGNRKLRTTDTGIIVTGTVNGDELNISGISTFAGQINSVNFYSTGISTVNALFANTIQTATLDLSGSNIYFTGLATFFQLRSNDAGITTLRGTDLNFTGISTLSRIYNTDIQTIGFTTTYNGLHVGAGGTIISAVATSGIGSVGINTATADRALHVYGDIQISGNTVVGTISTTRSNNSACKIHTELGRNDFRSVEYTVQASIGNTHQVTKILSIHDGVTAYNSEYSNISTGVDVASYDVQIDNTVPPGSIALVVTPVSNTGVTTFVVNFVANKI